VKYKPGMGDDKPAWNKLSACGCGGHAKVVSQRLRGQVRFFHVSCDTCLTKTGLKRFTRADAAGDWESMLAAAKLKPVKPEQ